VALSWGSAKNCSGVAPTTTAANSKCNSSYGSRYWKETGDEHLSKNENLSISMFSPNILELWV